MMYTIYIGYNIYTSKRAWLIKSFSTSEKYKIALLAKRTVIKLLKYCKNI